MTSKRRILRVDFSDPWLKFWDRLVKDLVRIGWTKADAMAWAMRTLERTPDTSAPPPHVGRPRKDLTAARAVYDDLRREGVASKRLVEKTGFKEDFRPDGGVSRSTIRRRIHLAKRRAVKRVRKVR